MGHRRWPRILLLALGAGVGTTGCSALSDFGGFRFDDGGSTLDSGSTNVDAGPPTDAGLDARPCVDEDVDDVCDDLDRCLGHDDAQDADGDAIPDGCDCDQSGGDCSDFADCASAPDGVACACRVGYEGDGTTCTPVDCGALEGPADGRVTAAVTTLGGTAEYACDDGYELVGDPIRTCREDGSWSGAAPSCALASCGPLTDPPNGVVTTSGTTFGSVSTYACIAGYRLVGSDTRTCQTDGTWSGSEPSCELVDCGALSAPANGRVSAPSTTAGSSADYACDGGYVLAGAPRRVCQPDGTWSGSEPTCAPVDCGPLSAPANGSVSAASTTLGARATYACSAGFLLSGSGSRVCEASALWSGSTPTCVPVECGPLGEPANGSVSAPRTTYGAIATYVCNPGFSLSGSATRVCEASGTWSGSVPTCTPVMTTPRSCREARSLGGTTSGVYTVDPDGPGGAAAFSVYCDMTTAGGGWTLTYKVRSNVPASTNPWWNIVMPGSGVTFPTSLAEPASSSEGPLLSTRASYTTSTGAIEWRASTIRAGAIVFDVVSSYTDSTGQAMRCFAAGTCSTSSQSCSATPSGNVIANTLGGPIGAGGSGYMCDVGWTDCGFCVDWSGVRTDTSAGGDSSQEVRYVGDDSIGIPDTTTFYWVR